MVDKKACRIKQKKYKFNAPVFVTRITFLFILIAVTVTIANKIPRNINSANIVESSAYVDSNGISSMVDGVQNGAVYTDSVKINIKADVKNVTLTRDGENIKFKNGKKISKIGSYILTLEDDMKNIDTIYFDIER